MSDEIRAYILSEMNAAGSLEYTRRILSELYASMLVLLDDLEAVLEKNELLRSLILFLKV